jgi:hypothetical protein
MLAMALLLSACIPALPSLQQPEEAPAVDVQATDAAMAQTLEAETLNPLPTPTLPASDTPEPTSTPTNTATPTETATPTHVTVTVTLTIDPNVTITDTGTAITGTPITPTVTVTGTLPTVTQVIPTATETLHPRFYGTLPPALPFGKVKLINKSKAEVYVSLHCTTSDGYTTIIEYPVPQRLRVSAPAGKYTYVAWVGGRQFQGSFGLGKGNDIEITFFKDKVTIK